MKSKMLQASGQNFVETRKKLNRKIFLHRIMGWRKEGYVLWEEGIYERKHLLIMSQKIVK